MGVARVSWMLDPSFEPLWDKTWCEQLLWMFPGVKVENKQILVDKFIPKVTSALPGSPSASVTPGVDADTVRAPLVYEVVHFSVNLTCIGLKSLISVWFFLTFLSLHYHKVLKWCEIVTHKVTILSCGSCVESTVIKQTFVRLVEWSNSYSCGRWALWGGENRAHSSSKLQLDVCYLGWGSTIWWMNDKALYKSVFFTFFFISWPEVVNAIPNQA